jgi:hypothetical protein
MRKTVLRYIWENNIKRWTGNSLTECTNGTSYRSVTFGRITSNDGLGIVWLSVPAAQETNNVGDPM